jgi:hypothetical protein
MLTSSTSYSYNPIKIKKYYRQYINNYKAFNMEFTEFLSTKLGISEHDALRVVKELKSTTKYK